MRILIGYDGSESSRAAIKGLLNAGLPTSTEALVLSVADVFVPPPITEADDIFPMQVPDGVRRAHQRAERKVKEAASMAKAAKEEILKAFPQWRVEHEAIADSPAWAILRRADAWNADLIVVGAQGHSVMGGRLILGSVSQRVLYEASQSVRIARDRNKDVDSPVRIVIGVDGSPDSNAAVEAVCERGWPKGTQVRLLVVVDTVMGIPNDSQSGELRWIEMGDPDDWEPVRQIFEPAAAKLRSAGLDAAVMIRRGNPKDQIVEEAESWGADGIFVGAKGIRGIDRLLLGSVSSAVSARAQCSVEVVRPR